MDVEMSNKILPVPHEHIVSTEFDGGEGVLVDLNARHYYKLNETGMLIWRGLEKGDSFEEIINKMTATYDVTPEHAALSIEKLLNNLESSQLVRPR
jgi:predicted HTH transcriptional regulator